MLLDAFCQWQCLRLQQQLRQPYQPAVKPRLVVSQGRPVTSKRCVCGRPVLRNQDRCGNCIQKRRYLRRSTWERHRLPLYDAMEA